MAAAMALFRRKPDPISDRERDLKNEIARLESQIRELGGELQQDQTQPRLRSTAMPHTSTAGHGTPAPASPPAPGSQEPIFEEMGRHLLEARSEATTTPDHYNELGVCKYDLPALLRRLREHFRGPSTTNPKLVSYLAAGGIQGLRPLRYEKRVARNRFILFVMFLVLILLGLFLVFLKEHR
jgi:hypothetical protein